MYLNQHAAMREGLKYEGHDHKKAVKRMYMVNNLMMYLAENSTKFTAEDICRNIISAMLEPRARVEYIELGNEDLTERQDIISLIQTISRGIKCEIEVRNARKRTPEYKINHDSSSESDGGRDDDSHSGGGRRGPGKENMCRIPGHDHAWKDCPKNKWSHNYQGSTSRSRDDDDESRSRSRSPARHGARHRDRDRDRDRNNNRDESNRRERNCDRDRPRRSNRRQREVLSNESKRSDASSMGSPLVSFSQARDSVGSQDSDDWSSQYSYSDVSCSSNVF